MSSEVEETLKRIQSHRGVKGVLILNQEGIPIRSNLNQEDTDTYAALISQLNFKVVFFIVQLGCILPFARDLGTRYTQYSCGLCNCHLIEAICLCVMRKYTH
jgi:Roadblock/LC7 domain